MTLPPEPWAIRLLRIAEDWLDQQAPVVAQAIYDWLWQRQTYGPPSEDQLSVLEPGYRYSSRIEGTSVAAEFIVLVHERRLLIVRFDEDPTV